MPLILKLPGGGRGGATVAAPAQLVDVAPTLLALAGVAGPPEATGALPGLPLLGPAGAPARPIYAETFYPAPALRLERAASLIQDRSTTSRGRSRSSTTSPPIPGEKRNVLAAERRVYAALRADAASARRPLAAPAAGRRRDRPPARRPGLASRLGAAPAPGEAAPRSQEPKIGTPARLRPGHDRLLGQQRYAEAVPRLPPAAGGEPAHGGRLGAPRAVAPEARPAGRGAGRLQEGHGAPEALATWPSPPARLLLDMGRLDEARQHAELALATEPRVAHNLLGADRPRPRPPASREGGARRPGRPRLAHRAAADPGADAPEEGRLDKALETTPTRPPPKSPGRRATRSTPACTGLHGDLLARLGRDAEAERELPPGDPRLSRTTPAPTPASPSSMLPRAAAGGRSRALRRMVERNGSPAAYAEAVRTLRTLGDPRAPRRCCGTPSPAPGEPGAAGPGVGCREEPARVRCSKE